MTYIYSTLTSDNHYNVFDTSNSNGQSPIVRKSILVKGGTGVSNKHFVTPLGVVTNVTKEDLEILKKDEVFKTHVKNGFITFREDKVDTEVAAAEMETRDESAPLVPEDFKETGEVIDAKPVAAKKSGVIKNLE